MTEILKRHINNIWLLLVAAMFALLFLFPELLTRESIADLLQQMGPFAVTLYIALTLMRGFLLIPITPFVLAGAISFPQLPWFVLGISIISIVVGAYLVYSFPTFGGYDKILENRYPDQISTLKGKMQHKNAFWFVTGWSFFPLVPTDPICYVAGLAKMPYKKVITALLIGELPLITFYVFIGAELGEWLRA